MNITSPGKDVTDEQGNASRSWITWASNVSSLLTALSSSGSSRPTSFLFAGRPFFDTSLGMPIWYDGSGWVDATGASV